MNQAVSEAIDELKRAHAPSGLTVEEDGQGGARVIIEEVDLGERFTPSVTWLGGHITALYPNADIYPTFIGAEVRRTDGKDFEVPVTPNAMFMNRPAWQVSRVNNQLHLARQTAKAKFAKIVDFLKTTP